MKKRLFVPLIALLLSISLVTFLTACGGKDDKKEDEQTTQPPAAQDDPAADDIDWGFL